MKNALKTIKGTDSQDALFKRVLTDWLNALNIYYDEHDCSPGSQIDYTLGGELFSAYIAHGKTEIQSLSRAPVRPIICSYTSERTMIACETDWLCVMSAKAPSLAEARAFKTLHSTSVGFRSKMD